MAYITRVRANALIGDSVLGWSTLADEQQVEFLERASNRIEVIPFEDDHLSLKDGGYLRRPRYTDGVKAKEPDDTIDYPIPYTLELAVASLAVWYARNPNEGFHHASPDSEFDRSPLRDLPMDVRNALLGYITASLRSAEKADAPPVTGGASGLSFGDESAATVTGGAATDPAVNESTRDVVASFLEGGPGIRLDHDDDGSAEGRLQIRVPDLGITNAMIGPDLNERIYDLTHNSLVQGDNITLTKDDPNNRLTISAAAAPIQSVTQGENITASISAGVLTISATASDAGSIPDGSITAAKLASNAVTGAKIQANAVTTAKIADGAVTPAKIESNSITSTQIAAGAIGSDEIASNAIINSKIADNAIDTAEIQDNAITAAKLDGSIIGSANLVDGAVTEGKIADGAVTGEKIGADEVGAFQLNIAAGTNVTLGTANNVLTISASGGSEVSFATQAEVNAGTVTDEAVAPNTLRGLLENVAHTDTFPGFTRTGNTGANLPLGTWHINAAGTQADFRAHTADEYASMLLQIVAGHDILMRNATDERIEFTVTTASVISVSNSDINVIRCAIGDHDATPDNPTLTGQWRITASPPQNRQLLGAAPAGSIPAVAVAGGGGGGASWTTIAEQSVGTAANKDITGVEATESLIIMFRELSLGPQSGQAFRIRLGTSAGFVTTGYVSNFARSQLSSDSRGTSGFSWAINDSGANIECQGVLRFDHAGGNRWFMDGTVGSTGGMCLLTGVLGLPGALDRIQLRADNGVLDKGQITVKYM